MIARACVHPSEMTRRAALARCLATRPSSTSARGFHRRAGSRASHYEAQGARGFHARDAMPVAVALDPERPASLHPVRVLELAGVAAMLVLFMAAAILA